jgi:pimeloyl-ACP methyl ester carboxylesterase
VSLLIAGASALAGLAAYGAGFSAWAGLRWARVGALHKVDDARLHLVAMGAGADVLCLHGASANHREFAHIAEAHGDEFRFLLLDRPGHGHSSPARDLHMLARQAKLAAGVLAQASQGPAIVLAHSLGAAVALRLALDFPQRVRALVLIAPACMPYPGDNAWHAKLAATPVAGVAFSHLIVPLAAPLMAGRAIANTFAPATAPAGYEQRAGVPMQFRGGQFRANARAIVATNGEFAAQAPRYGEIAQPAIIIAPDKDRVVSPKRHALALSEAMPGAELVTAPGAGHMPHHVRPDLIIAALRRAHALAG